MMNRHSNSFWESLKSGKTKEKMCTTADEFPSIFLLKKNHDEKNAQFKGGLVAISQPKQQHCGCIYLIHLNESPKEIEAQKVIVRNWKIMKKTTSIRLESK